MNSLPNHPEKFTVEWLSEKLNFLPESLKNFSYESVGSGQVADSYRIKLNWNNDKGSKTIIAKCSARDSISRQTAKNMNLYEIMISECYYNSNNMNTFE